MFGNGKKGRSSFSAAEAKEIRALLRKKENATPPDQKKLRGSLRKKYGFYITDFGSIGTEFTVVDFDVLVKSGVIKVQGSSRAAGMAPRVKTVRREKTVRSRLDATSLASAASLRRIGFDGFVAVTNLLPGILFNVPALPGVYLVLHDRTSNPKFLEIGTGGHFKGKNPNQPIARLKDEWVDGAAIVYVGQNRKQEQRNA